MLHCGHFYLLGIILVLDAGWLGGWVVGWLGGAHLCVLNNSTSAVSRFPQAAAKTTAERQGKSSIVKCQG